MADGLIQQVMEQHLVAAAQKIEDDLDNQLHALENLNDDDLETLRQRRIDQLKRQAEKKKGWIAKGHGEYREILSEKEFFSEMKTEERMICHFFRENWPCKVCDDSDFE